MSSIIALLFGPGGISIKARASIRHDSAAFSMHFIASCLARSLVSNTAFDGVESNG